MNTFENKTVVITGASSGAGLAMALELAIHRCNLVLAARNLTALQDAVDECRQLGANAQLFGMDVSEERSMIGLAAFAEEHFGKVDVWINNAGVLAAGAFDQTPLEIHDQVVKTNLLGYMHGCHAILPYFKRQGFGQIINNISVGAFMPVPFGAAYSASKFGLKGFSEALRAELSDWPDIHISDIFPAFIDTPGIRHAANYTGKEIKPAPPISDPRRVARAVIKLIERPRNSYDISLLTPFIRVAHALAPSVLSYATAAFMRLYFKQAEDVPSTSGNLFNTLKFGNSVDGGHLLKGRGKSKRLAAGSLLLGAALLLAIKSRGR